MAGLLQARLPELVLEEVPDPRARVGRWSLAQILRATLQGLLAGCGSLAEALTDSLALPFGLVRTITRSCNTAQT